MKSRVTILKAAALFSSFALVLSYNACSNSNPFGPGSFLDASHDFSSTASLNLSDAAAVQDKAIQILATNCTSCHMATAGPLNIFNLTDVNHLIQTGLVVPGQPGSSPLMTPIESNSMPPSGGLGDADKQVLRAWIAAGAAVPTSPPTTLPPGSPPPTLPPTPGTGTGNMADQAIAILQTNCYSCHGTATNGGLTKINDVASLIAGKWVIPGDAINSPIYDAVSKGRMPVGGMLSSSDISVIANWINQGASAPSAAVPPPPTLPPLGPSYSSLAANVFTPKCVGCHGPSLARSGVRLDSYTNVLRYVSKGYPSSSKVYDITVSGEMPPSPNPDLTAAELKALSDWIKAGAPNN